MFPQWQGDDWARKPVLPQWNPRIPKGGYHGPGSSPLNTPQHSQYTLAASGWYTPEAMKQIYNVPVWRGNVGDYAAASYDPIVTGSYNGLVIPDDFYSTYDPLAANEIIRHEYNHAFDDRTNWRSGEQAFEDLAHQTVKYFPGMWGQPMIRRPDGSNWGGSDELYADVGNIPFNAPQARSYYPQYTDKAYEVPIGWGWDSGQIEPQTLHARETAEMTYWKMRPPGSPQPRISPMEPHRDMIPGHIKPQPGSVGDVVPTWKPVVATNPPTPPAKPTTLAYQPPPKIISKPTAPAPTPSTPALNRGR